MNGVGTGLILLALGLLAFLPAYVAHRKSGAPFVERSMIGGYTGVVGVGFIVCAIVIIVWSSALMVLR